MILYNSTILGEIFRAGLLALDRSQSEAADTLAEWVEVQIAGIQRSSMPPASEGALAAFVEVRKKIDELREGQRTA